MDKPLAGWPLAVWGTRFALVLFACAVALPATSCAGDNNGAANPMSLVEFLLVDEALQPTAPTGALSLPRNARLLMVFSELVNPATTTTQTIQVRHGPSLSTIPTGSYRVQGNSVVFDPTISAAGQPNPFGFLPVTQYQVVIPGFDEFDGDAVVENLDFDPNVTTFKTSFTTGDGFLRELVPPEVVRVYFIPARDELTRNVPGDGIMAIEFNEAIDPASLFLGGPAGPGVNTSIDVRFNDDPTNVVATVDGKNVPGRLTQTQDAKTVLFRPTFSFGDTKLVFTTSVLQGVRDLAGNLLVNPQSFGPYVCDGEGARFGKTIEEHFETNDDEDGPNDAKWGATQGTLEGADIASRPAYFYTYNFTDSGADSGRGEYAQFYEPLVGAAINAIFPGITPPTSQGRRTLCTFADTEIGPAGTVTGAAWGPDSNATRAATYPRVVLRCGFQADADMSLGPSFSGNYMSPPAVLYDGEYDVVQNSNVGNPIGQPQTLHQGPYPVAGPGTVCWPAGGLPNNNYNRPLFDFTGWYDWPEFTAFFDWDPGDPLVAGDRVFLFDTSVAEGDTWQFVRGWYAVDMPCSTTALVGQPFRNSLTTFENDAAIAGYPTTTLVDASFTITRKVSTAQSLFYLPTGDVLGTAMGGDTYGTDTDYLEPQISPTVQAGGAEVFLEFQGAMAIVDRSTVNTLFPDTGWTVDIHDCDGFPYIRWRATLTSNLVSMQTAKLNAVILPMLDVNP